MVGSDSRSVCDREFIRNDAPAVELADSISDVDQNGQTSKAAEPAVNQDGQTAAEVARAAVMSLAIVPYKKPRTRAYKPCARQKTTKRKSHPSGTRRREHLSDDDDT